MKAQFLKGSRVNDCYVAKKNGNTLEWRMLLAESSLSPRRGSALVTARSLASVPALRWLCSRARLTFSAKITKEYAIFGGMSDDNIKLNDLWETQISAIFGSSISLLSLTRNWNCRQVAISLPAAAATLPISTMAKWSSLAVSSN